MDLVLRELTNLSTNYSSSRENLEPTIDTVKILRESCVVAVDILNELLLYEKIEEGIMALDTSFVVPDSFLENAVRPFRVSARAKDIQLNLTLEALSPVEEGASSSTLGIKVDAGKMAQVVRNYLSNAIKFTPPHGTVTVALTYMKKAQSDVNCMVRIEVELSNLSSSLSYESTINHRSLHL